MILKTLMGLCLLLLVCGGWQCNTALVEELVPTVEEAPPFDLRELIHAEDAVIYSPIRTDWAEWLWPNQWHPDYYRGKFRDDPMTKCIADRGIAVVATDAVPDKALHQAAGVIRAMLWKLPEVWKVLSLKPTVPEIGVIDLHTGRHPILLNMKPVFRFALFGEGEWPGGEPLMRTDNPDALLHGQAMGTRGAWAKVSSYPYPPGVIYLSTRTVVHEMAHVIHHVIQYELPHLYPDFQERLEAAYENAMARVAAGERPLCFHEPDAYAYTNVQEFWAQAVTIYWFSKGLWATSDPPEPDWVYVDPDVDYADYDDLDANLLYPFYPDEERLREICGDLVDLLSEVFHMPSRPAN